MISQQNVFSDRLNVNVVAIAVAAATWALPVVSPVFMGLQIFAPLPACYFLVELGTRRGFTTLTVALLISGIISFMIGQTGVFMFTTLMLPAGLSLGRDLLRMQASPVRAGFKSLLVLLSVWLLWALVSGINRPSSTGIYNDILTSLDAGLIEVGQTLKGNTSLEPEQALEVEAAITRLQGLLPRVMPGLLFVTLLNAIFFNMVVGQYFLRRRNAELVPWPPFAAWRLPEPVVALVIVAGFCLLIPMPLVNDIGLNLLLVAGTLYFFQGLALLASLLNRWSVPSLLRALIFLLLLIQAYGIVLLAAVGLIDVWANFRSPRPKPEDDEI
jgi:uncharacterized protein YybS (DUF2232 family)